MKLVGLIAALLILFACGLGLTLLLLRNAVRINLPEALALGWLFGCGLISLSLWPGGLGLSGVPLQLATAMAALSLFVLGFRGMLRHGSRLFFPRPHGIVEWIFATVLLAEILVMIYAGFSHGLGWDGLLNWEVKARYAFFNHGIVPPEYFRDSSRAFTHPAYPLLVPMTELWIYLAMNEPNQFWIKIVFPLFYTAGATLLAVNAARLTNRSSIGLAVATLMFFVPCLTNAPGDAAGGYSDLPLGVAYFAASAYLLIFAMTGDASAWRIFATSLALLPWIKHEGLVLWFVAASSGVLVHCYRRGAWRALLWLMPGPMIVGCWQIFLRSLHAWNKSDFAPATWANLRANESRIIPIVRLVFGELLTLSSWSLLWPGVALPFIAFALRERTLPLLLLGGTIAAPIPIYAATYILTNWDFTTHFQRSFSRLLLHLLPLAWLAIALAFALQSDSSLSRDTARQSRTR